MVRRRGHKLSEQDILTLFRDIHGNRYRYSPLPEQFTVHSIIPILCPLHGEFRQSITHHLHGQGCPACARIQSNDRQRLGRTEWIHRFESVHGRGTYDYSKVPDNLRQDTRIEIICREHGTSFYQTPNLHWRLRQGCPACGIDKRWEARRLHLITRREYEQRARAVHGPLFEYSELPLEFSLNDTVIIYCNVHAHAFFCTAGNHLEGQGCGR